MLTTPNVQLKVQFAEILSAEQNFCALEISSYTVQHEFIVLCLSLCNITVVSPAVHVQLWKLQS